MTARDESLMILEADAVLPLIEVLDLVKMTAEVTGKVLRPLGGGVVYLIIEGSAEAVLAAEQAVSARDDLTQQSLRWEVMPHPAPEVRTALKAAAGLAS